MPLRVKSDLNLRTFPRKSSSSLGILKPGSLLVEMKRADGWVPVTTEDGRVGWVHGDFVEEVGSGATPAAPAPAPKPGGWRVAKSLDMLLRQINETAPKRKKSHDGSIGDQAHQARKSEHNPDQNGVVRARDFMHDPAGGCDCEALAQALVKSRDRRILYIIWNGRIVRSYPKPGVPEWTWTKYTGTNQHTAHLHLSVVESPVLYDDARPWLIR